MVVRHVPITIALRVLTQRRLVRSRPPRPSFSAQIRVRRQLEAGFPNGLEPEALQD